MGKRSGIMLARPLEERRLLHPKFKWGFPNIPVITQPKLDGERARNLPTGLVSSEVNPIQSVPHIDHAIHHQGFNEIELDGELWAPGLDFGEIHSRVSRQSSETLHPRAHEIGFYIFDVVIPNMPQMDRFEYLESLKLKPPLYLIPHRFAGSIPVIMRDYGDYLKEGYEGIIVRHPFAYYVRKRSLFMLKFKPKKFDWYEIIGVNQAISKDSTPLPMLGSFNCRDQEGNEFSVGAGNLDHKTREAIWYDHLDGDVIGDWCKVAYQHLTSANGVPRFGLAAEVDKVGEKA